MESRQPVSSPNYDSKSRDALEVGRISWLSRGNVPIARFASGTLDVVATHSIVAGVLLMFATFAIVFCSYVEFDSAAPFIESTNAQIVGRETLSAQNRTIETVIEDVVKNPTFLPIRVQPPSLGQVDSFLRRGYAATLGGLSTPGEAVPAAPVSVAETVPSEAPARLADVTRQAGPVQPLPFFQVKMAQARIAPQTATGRLRKVFYDKPVFRNGRWVLWHGAGRDG
jgi:hypothetical protein